MWEGQAQGLMVLDVTTKEAEEVPGEQARKEHPPQPLPRAPA